MRSIHRTENKIKNHSGKHVNSSKFSVNLYFWGILTLKSDVWTHSSVLKQRLLYNSNMLRFFLGQTSNFTYVLP